MNKILQLYRDNAGREKRPVNVARNADEASLYIYDVIDSYWGVSAVQVIDALGQVADAQVLNVYINSPGGDVFEGRAIMAALSRFAGKKIAHIDSLCASAATSIALACDEVEITEGAFFMIHNASGFAWGDKNAMRETADLLEKVEGSIVHDYVSKTGKDDQQIIGWMNAETWFNATEALDNGFVDRVTPSPTANKSATNMWNLAAYARVPQALTNAVTPKEPVKPQAKVVVTPSAEGDDALNADEVKFLREMAVMHEAAIALAKEVLPLATSDDVEDLAESIISSQAGELELMKTWIDLGATPEPDEGPEPAPNNSVSQSVRNRLTLLQL
jgi:ATP-dependent protease ClpP protease subunit